MLDDDIVVQNVDDDDDVEEDDLLCDLFTIKEYQSITIEIPRRRSYQVVTQIMIVLVVVTTAPILQHLFEKNGRYEDGRPKCSCGHKLMMVL